MRLLFYILFIFPSFFLSQNFFLESGGCVNAPGTKSFYYSDGDSRGGNEWKGTVSSMPSYYFKAGVEKLFPLKNRVQISLPFTISYFNAIDKTEMDGGSWGCFVYSYGHKSIVSNKRTGDFSLGLNLVLNATEKISVQAGFNTGIRAVIIERSKVTHWVNDNLVNDEYTNTFSDVSLRAGAVTGIFYKVTERVKIGVNAEVHFLNKYMYKLYTRSYYAGYKHFTSFLNVGFRIQHSF